MKNRWWLAALLSPIAVIGVVAVTMAIGLVLRLGWHIVVGGDYPWWLGWDPIWGDALLAVLIASFIAIVIGRMVKRPLLTALGGAYLILWLMGFAALFVWSLAHIH